eukprot:gene16594-16775_t
MLKIFLKIPEIAIVWGSFFIAGLIVYVTSQVLVKRDQPAKSLRQCFVSEYWSTKSAIVDLVTYLLGKVTVLAHNWATPLITLFVSGLVSGLTHSLFPGLMIGHSSLLVLALCGLGLFVIADLSGYLSHLAQHYVPLLWEFHKVHHSAIFLNPLTARRGHPLGVAFDDIVQALIMGAPTGILVAIFHFNLTETAFLVLVTNKFFFITSLETLQHSHYPISFGPLERVFISPHMHQIHHSSCKEHWDKNFGVIFSVWDWLFGTAYKPHAGEFIVYGVGKAETAEYQDLYGVYVGPFKKIGRLFKYGVSKPPYPTTPRRPLFEMKGVLWRDPAATSAAPTD